MDKKTKICTICREEKAFEFFNKESRRKDGHSYLCKPCCNRYHADRRKKNPEPSREATRKYRKNNPRNKRNSALKNVYGITIDQYEEMLKKQNFQCAICKIDAITLNRNLDVDHDHLSGTVRGLLCNKCNQGMGLLREDVEILKGALEYLERHRENR